MGYIRPGGLRSGSARTPERLETLYHAQGFDVADGRIEDDYHNFEALNIRRTTVAGETAPHFDAHRLLHAHPAVQVRYMKQNPPPLRVIAAGRVYTAATRT